MNCDIRRKESCTLDAEQFLDVFNFIKQIPWLEELLEGYLDLHNFCINNDERYFIKDIIRKFKYVSYKELSNYTQKLVDYIEKDIKATYLDTMIYSLADNHKPDGSHTIIQMMKNKFSDLEKWGEYNFSTNINDINSHKEECKNIFIVDDYIGTGNTVARKLTYVKNILQKRVIKGCNIYILSIAAMKFAKKKLDTLDVNYYSVIWLDKGISETYPKDQIKDARALMLMLEDRLEAKHNNQRLPSLGFEESEALFSIEDFNIPNNVFPIFWWPYLKDGQQRKTMFKRAKK